MPAGGDAGDINRIVEAGVQHLDVNTHPSIVASPAALLPRNGGGRPLMRMLKDCISNVNFGILDLEEGGSLLQFWMPPTEDPDNETLVTRGMPFMLGPCGDNLAEFRGVSCGLTLSGSLDDLSPGMVGRVYLKGRAEFTPNVHLFDSVDYLRAPDAMRLGVKACVVLPVFSGPRVPGEDRSPDAVMEIVFAAEAVNLCSILTEASRALAFAGLATCSLISQIPREQLGMTGQDIGLEKIAQLLRVVSSKHTVPLGQVWMACDMDDLAVEDPETGVLQSSAHMPAFAQAGMEDLRLITCEQPLHFGQGGAGLAAKSMGAEWVANVQQLAFVEYPLLHCAKVLHLHGVLDITLKPSGAAESDPFFVAEFFLPPGMKDINQQKHFLEPLAMTLRDTCKELGLACPGRAGEG
eukprot:CAMPEP_0182864100 /NCGR_PEP_ID=MMETSP0034_2-20130328/6996_1 /TAXON_ID=156128 /ORGANISM="Nephroselmis pyriformis, Strain CCMP717" /LENGTH=407 /DNA_ID=CAMNT_0024996349 /DNA_START=263 /DNA_END=1482 /DNA_ORIENTATION=-